ncbi:unnamed protein product, partial [Durusdinium trenchii]
MKRRRIVGKQPVALEAIVEHAPSAVVLADDAADNTNIEEEDADGASGPPDRFRFLHHKVIDRIVSALLKTKTDEELHTMTVSTLLKEVVGRSHGKVSLEEVEDRRDDFISASMELIPKMLAARLVDAVKKGSKAVEGTLVAPAEIDSQTKQKSYFITISGLPLSGAPSRDEVLDIMLASFKEGGYESSAYLSHVAVFREKHADAEKIHFHICACVSQRIRWVPWAKALRLRGLAPSFSQVVVEDPADHRRKQYSYMLRYCYLPTKRKPLETLDSSPLLWCHQGKHAPLIDAINGVLDAAGVRLDAEDAFLQRVAAGKKGAKRFTDIQLWPVVQELGLQGSDPLLMPKLFRYARQRGNTPLLNYLFRNSATVAEKVDLCYQLERCDEIIQVGSLSLWKRFTAALETPCVCDGAWARAAREVVFNNQLDEPALCKDIKKALLSGLHGKGDCVTFAGFGNEGKSFIL